MLLSPCIVTAFAAKKKSTSVASSRYLLRLQKKFGYSLHDVSGLHLLFSLIYSFTLISVKTNFY